MTSLAKSGTCWAARDYQGGTTSQSGEPVGTQYAKVPSGTGCNAQAIENNNAVTWSDSF